MKRRVHKALQAARQASSLAGSTHKRCRAVCSPEASKALIEAPRCPRSVAPLLCRCGGTYCFVGSSAAATNVILPFTQQVRDLNRGSYGAVVLALDRQTGQEVAIKYIERGAEVRGRLVGSGGRFGRVSRQYAQRPNACPAACGGQQPYRPQGGRL